MSLQNSTSQATWHTLVRLTILITGLGYFIDSFDAFLFNVTRVVSLTDLGLEGDQLTRAGVFILNCQVTGTLVGGIFWGIMGDRIGRKKALLGSILVYSVGMFASAYVVDVNTYAISRAIVGFGIAGEVGLGATLVGEIVQNTKRTYGLAFFTALGLLGVTAAALSIEFVHWRTSCILGGVGGLLLLFLRHRLFESPLFEALAKTEAEPRGQFLRVLTNGTALKKWLCCIFILAPNFFVTGLLLTLAPEITKAAGLNGAIKANLALAAYFTCAVIGDLMSAWLSERFKSRRIVLSGYMLANALLAYTFIMYPPTSLPTFYGLCGLLGLFNLWAISTTATVEQFNTNLRATVTTTSMNFARACLVPMNLTLLHFKVSFGLTAAAVYVGAGIFIAGFCAVFALHESYGRPLEETVA